MGGVDRKDLYTTEKLNELVKNKNFCYADVFITPPDDKLEPEENTDDDKASTSNINHLSRRLKMDQRITDTMRERSRRSIRNKRYNRRTYSEDKRPPKRLFTPEIKKFLKDWLVRRRDNPYPNRDEKKTLAIQTGLTYIQVCNWFANWRRKLKNSGAEPQKRSWGYLIKTYNSQVQGNVEHFSICSEDSIWEEPELNGLCDIQTNTKKYDVSTLVTEINAVKFAAFCDKQNNGFLDDIKSQNNNCLSQCVEKNEDVNPFSQHTNKYKNHIIEKYLRDCQKPENFAKANEFDDKPSMISKWLESAENFKPSENNYLNWTLMNYQRRKCKKSVKTEENAQHGKEELDAAEALTCLATSKA
ncbi:hypothetical protein RN001_008579 [Aquatica leii]|uniref:Homeobox domain-containing protein n=1 Tax=Aquatica leii TaxID=1421715 RepID=A0AAN7PAX2_9COLE|nr:hypothetical protein RN001_008579 [Aquatica leii]